MKCRYKHGECKVGRLTACPICPKNPETEKQSKLKITRVSEWAEEINSRIWTFQETQEITTQDMINLDEILTSKEEQ